jgi:hypothetical protein
MAEKKSLVEEAIMQMENLQDAISNNAKGILASTMKEEISELVKESLSEEDEVKESETEMSEQEELDLDVEVEDEDEGEESLELDLDALSDNEDDEELEMGDEEMLMTDLPGDDLEVDDSEEVLSPLDLTMASDEEVLKVFKAMGEDDGIIVKQDDDEIHLSDNESDAEYVIQLGESEEEMTEGDYTEEEEMTEGDYTEEEEMTEGDYTEEDIVYEIEIDEEDMEPEVKEGEYGGNKGDIKAADRRKDGHYGKGPKNSETAKEEGELDYEETKEQRSNANLRKVPNARKASEPTYKYASDRMRPAVRENEELKKEVQQLREKNEEYRKALNIFKEKLNEVAVFNSNLAYATRLFTEHSTTKQEKINILRRFDSVETLKESKSLYKTIKEDFDGKETSVMTESVTSKVQKTPSKGSANNLIESKTYENPQFLRMKDLMDKIKK